MIKKINIQSILIKVFFSILLLELFLLGSGQILSWNGISLRMFLYSLTMFTSFLFLIIGIKLAKQVSVFVLLFISMITFSTLIGAIAGSTLSAILFNLKPLLYALMIIPFSLFINNIETIVYIEKLIKFSSLLMGISLLMLLFLLYIGYFEFNTIYVFLSADGTDFMMNDGEIVRLFYKGFLYLNIAFIFYIYSNNRYKFLILFLLFLSILLTFTRGFLLAMVLSFIFISILEFKKKKTFSVLVGILICVAILLPFYTNIIGEKDASDSIRILQIEEVFNAITVTSFFIGHGFGIGVPIRPDGMEITFLEIFHKQGILGLFLWIGFLFYMIFNYLNIRNLTYKKIFKPFLVSTFFVYFQSLTNPYLNNPIGMSMVLLTFSVLIFIMYLESKERHTNVNLNSNLQ